MTSLELKASTQKSRIAELEGSLNSSYESNNKAKKDHLILQEKHSRLNREVTTEKSFEIVLDPSNFSMNAKRTRFVI